MSTIEVRGRKTRESQMTLRYIVPFWFHPSRLRGMTPLSFLLPSASFISRVTLSSPLGSEKVSRDAISPCGHSFCSELPNEPYQSLYYFFYEQDEARGICVIFRI